MDDLYWIGYFIVLGIHIVKTYSGFVVAYSIKARNMGSIEKYYSFWTGDFTRYEKIGVGYFLIYAIYAFGISPFFSWVGVFLFILEHSVGFLTKTPNPDKIKEFIWIISKIPMTKKEIQELEKRTNNSLGIPQQGSD